MNKNPSPKSALIPACILLGLVLASVAFVAVSAHQPNRLLAKQFQFAPFRVGFEFDNPTGQAKSILVANAGGWSKTYALPSHGKIFVYTIVDANKEKLQPFEAHYVEMGQPVAYHAFYLGMNVDEHGLGPAAVFTALLPGQVNLSSMSYSDTFDQKLLDRPFYFKEVPAPAS
jgi:hypothetical protein